MDQELLKNVMELDDWWLGLIHMGFCTGISGRICQAFSMVFGTGQNIGRWS